jgi:hypothetical protein
MLHSMLSALHGPPQELSERLTIAATCVILGWSGGSACCGLHPKSLVLLYVNSKLGDSRTLATQQSVNMIPLDMSI